MLAYLSHQRASLFIRPGRSRHPLGCTTGIGRPPQSRSGQRARYLLHRGVPTMAL